MLLSLLLLGSALTYTQANYVEGFGEYGLVAREALEEELLARSLSVNKRALGLRACSVAPTTTLAVSSKAKTSSTVKSSSTKTSTSASSTSSTASGKIAGLAWNNNAADSMTAFSKGSVSWYYTWSPWPVGSAAQAGMEFVPMLWSAKQMSDWNYNVGGYKNLGVKWILGFNEPNEVGQANMSPADAVTLWNQVLVPVRQQYGFKLVSPACSGGPDSIPWYTNFFNGLTPAQMPDALGVHWYGTDANALISYLLTLSTTFNMPIWLTEWACQDYSGQDRQCTADQVTNFMTTGLRFLRHNPNIIAREAWFGALKSAMAGVNQLDCLYATTTIGDPTLSSIGTLYTYGNV